MHKILCPSIMNLSIDTLPQQIEKLNQADIDIYHIDIMDGNFVPNFGMSPREIEMIRAMTDKEIDVHLMVENPGRYIEMFADLGCDIIYIHLESDPLPTVTLDRIRKLGKKAGLVINPGTPIEQIRPLYALIDYLMIMSVNPGFCGQSYLEYVEPKIIEIAKDQQKYSFHIVIDGGVNKEIVTRLSKYGVEGYVLGNLILFKQEETDYKKIVNEIREL